MSSSTSRTSTAAAGSADVQCAMPTGTGAANFVKITAIKVANLTNSGAGGGSSPNTHITARSDHLKGVVRRRRRHHSGRRRRRSLLRGPCWRRRQDRGRRRQGTCPDEQRRHAAGHQRLAEEGHFAPLALTRAVRGLCGPNGPRARPGRPALPAPPEPPEPPAQQARATRTRASANGPIAVPASLTTLASLTIPQGGGNDVAPRPTSTGSGVTARCTLNAAGDSDQSRPGRAARPSRQTTTLNVVHNFGGAGSVDFQCRRRRR